MLIPTPGVFKLASCLSVNSNNKNTSCCSIATTTTGLFAAAAVVIASAAGIEEGETLSNIPQQLSGECSLSMDCSKPRIQRPKSRKAESCTIKCVGTCIRGGQGSPGEGPLNAFSSFQTRVSKPSILFGRMFRYL
ncbi:hypothetical protein LWI29_029455 [Acer saccharum]|uniref:Uncharacterized protein n=1 Tax=Acer saccharum TaxID=4024 RepID=A0AA39TF63_ACESA|nr:hypothetical protein LWI29_029455 [Acer saccharum]